MRITNTESTPMAERVHARQGVLRFWPLLEGDDASPGNFMMMLGKTYSDFQSPRHRHNFDQLRFQVEGDGGFGRDGDMEPGMLGYFPEGVFYGPQTVKDEALTLVLQVGGASGQGYMSDQQFQDGVAALKQIGAFEGGYYVRREGGRTRRKDAYQAVWEHKNGRPMVHPKSRYTKPVFMNANAFSWRPDPDHKGVSRKLLGVFSERRTAVQMLRLEAGAEAVIPANTLLFTLSGRGEAAGQAWGPRAALYTEIRDDRVRADEPAEMLEITLPEF